MISDQCPELEILSEIARQRCLQLRECRGLGLEAVKKTGSKGNDGPGQSKRSQAQTKRTEGRC